MLSRIAFILALSLALAAPAFAADQLIMFEQAGCPFCAAWNRDVGGIYPKTDEARMLPLRRVDIHAARPADLQAIGDVHFTPTFVVLHCGRESARLIGYSGQDNFWGLLDRDITALKGEPPCRS